MRLPNNRRGGNTPTSARTPVSSAAPSPNRSLSTSAHNRIREVRLHDCHMTQRYPLFLHSSPGIV